MTQTLTPFHLAIAVRDLAEARDFYGNRLGFAEGRSDTCWVDFNMMGHQLVAHVDPSLGKDGKLRQIHNHVDSHGVPIPHFGVVLPLAEWRDFAARLEDQDMPFLIPPTVRFKGLPGEQCTLFFEDPSGNALEFKAFADIERALFAT